MAGKFDWSSFEADAPAAQAPSGPSGASKFKWDSFQAEDDANTKAPADNRGAALAGLEHFGDAASLGYLPHLQALVAQAIPDPNKDLDAKLRAQGFNVQTPKQTYLSERDANIKRLADEAAAHPYASAAGSVGGALASGIATSAVAPINAASRVGRVLQAAKGGALLGALSNPGDTEGQAADGLQLGDRAKNAGIGGALSGAGQGVIEGLAAGAKAITNLPETLQAKAEERAFASTGAKVKDYRIANKPGAATAEDMGRYMLDNGLNKPGMSAKDIAEAAETLKDQHGQAIGEILNHLDEAGANAPTHEAMAQEIEKLALPYKDLNTARPTYNALQDLAADIRTMGKEPAVNVATGEVGSLTGRGTEYLTDPKTGEVMAKFRNGRMITEAGPAPVSAEMAAQKTAITPTGMAATDVAGTFNDLQGIKKFVGDQVNKTGGFKSLNPSEKNLALNQAYSLISDKLENAAGAAAESSGDQNLLNNYLAQKSGYKTTKRLGEIAADEALKQKANAVSFGDKVLGGGGALIGAMTGDTWEDRLKHAAIGGALGVGNKLARTYGTPFVSAALDKTGAALARTPLGALGEVTAPALAAIERSPVASSIARVINSPTFEHAEQGAMRGVADSGAQLKGEDRWAQQGASALGLSGDQLSKVLASKQGKQLLIQASDLPPGSKAAKRIKDQIQKGWGQ